MTNSKKANIRQKGGVVKNIKIESIPRFDAAEYLKTEADIADYLTVVLEENDPSALADALGTIARAQGMTNIAKAAGLGRESLYKALRADADPRFDTVQRVCTALGVRLMVVPAH